MNYQPPLHVPELYWHMANSMYYALDNLAS